MILGTAQLGQEYGIHNKTGKPSEDMAYQILDCAWKHGIRMLDTAGAYGDAEDLIGKYQEATGHIFRVCTKLSADITGKMYSNKTGYGNDGTYVGMAGEMYGKATEDRIDENTAGTAEWMEGELEKSLRRLRCRQVWLYYLHRFEACKSHAVMQKMEAWKSQGKIGKIGISIYEPEELEYIVEWLPDAVDVVQIPFHLLDNVRWMEGGLLQRAKEKGIQIFARSVFLQGLFFQDPNAEPAKRLQVQEALLSIHQLAEECSMDIQQLAVSFVACHPYIDEFLLGCETVGQLMQNIALEEKADKRQLTDADLKKIADISRKVNEIAIDPRRWKGK